ncbi:MAG: hypothetical protein LBH98_07335 [Chitinispirillales bacterium]|jgi:hypothetical protein|nr:hypothetical protein [Chitinispirillales bacterium]
MKKIIFVLLLLFISLFAENNRLVRVDTVNVHAKNRKQAFDLAEIEVKKMIADNHNKYVKSTTRLTNNNGKENFTEDMRVRNVFATDIVRTEILDIKNRKYVVRVITSTDTSTFAEAMYEIHNREYEKNEILQKDLDRANARQQRRDEVYKEIMVITTDAQKETKDWQQNSTTNRANSIKRNNAMSILGDEYDGCVFCPGGFNRDSLYLNKK